VVVPGVKIAWGQLALSDLPNDVFSAGSNVHHHHHISLPAAAPIPRMASATSEIAAQTK